ncbi:MAG: hypothetical protein QM780_12295 [Hyphomicrobium sp.]|uniref:hypothetical protein n=1 Tax=Hyphomicrobium sp. TaxID=82 RepID=UPI0039E6396A
MSVEVSDIKPAEIYSDLTADDIAEMMAEAARVDALFKSGRISTMTVMGLAAKAAADAEAKSSADVAATAA